MQSVEISGLKEIQKRLEGYPEAMKKARSEFFEEAGREMLSTVRRRIGGQGYVANVQDRHVGSGGGYALSKPPSEINMEDVFLHLEGEISPVSCLGRGKVCQREGLCSTRAFWHQLDEHVRDFLRHQTLQNIIESERSCCQDPGEHHVELH